MDQDKLSFMLRAVTDLLPSPSNLSLWGKQSDSKCPQCGQEDCTLRHILSACPKALSEGRYTWRHNKVLKEIAQFLHLFIEDRRDKGKVTEKGILTRANDWKLDVDIGKNLRFPPDIIVTSLRPDMVVTSRRSRTIIVIELSVPWENNIAERHEFKMSKYQNLTDELTRKQWNTRLFAVEVGARGFPAKSLRFMFKELGLPSSSIKKACNVCGESAEEASRWLWIKKYDSWGGQV